MFRKALVIFLSFIAVVTVNGCTSHSSDSQAELSDSPDDSLDVEGDSGGEDAVADLGDEASELSEDEQLPEDTASTETSPADSPDALTDNETPVTDATQEPTPEPVAETAPETTEPAAETPVEETASTPTPEPSENPSDLAAAAAPTGGVSLKKIKAAPEQFGKKWLNAVYVARDGDDPKTMSQKIYGSEDYAKQLCRWNSYNCGRGIKVGDKIYYNSPNRPDDDQNMKTFYEDAGVPAESYVAKDGDNIRAVGKQLLGHDRSWIELWVTNPDVESKNVLPEGTQLKYWPATETAAPTQTMAQTEAPPVDEMQVAEGSEEVAGGAPPPPPMEEMAPPPADLPPQDMAAQGSIAPPPPPQEMAPPPPPPPLMPEKSHATPAAAEMDDPNQTMALGGAAILMLGAVVLIISIRKKRRNKIDYNTATHTQIDT